MNRAMSEQPAGSLTRRGFIRRAGAAALGVPAVGGLTAGACAPGAAPETGSQGAGPTAGRAAWEEEWDRLVEAAKKEGAVSVVTNPGAGFRQVLELFEEAFPGVTVEHQASGSASLLMPKVTQERNAGIYSLDVGIFTIQSLLSVLKPTGAFDPLRPALMRPDVTEDKLWRFGFEFGFADKEKRWVFSNVVQSEGAIWVNGDLVKEGEIKGIRDLLDPKWKGKVLSTDVRAGGGFVPMTAVRIKMGDDFLKQLVVDQQLVFRRERGEVAREMARGTFPVAIGMNRAVLQEFLDQGLGKSLKPIQLPELLYNTAHGVWLFNRAPHPNAARLLANWSLTKAGQETWSKAYQYNSLRSDVALYDPENPPIKEAVWMSAEENIPVQNETRDFLVGLLR